MNYRNWEDIKSDYLNPVSDRPWDRQEKEMKFKVEVNTFGDPVDSWAGNAITHASCAQAKIAAENLFDRWTAVKFWRVVDQDGKVCATNGES